MSDKKKQKKTKTNDYIWCANSERWDLCGRRLKYTKDLKLILAEVN